MAEREKGTRRENLFTELSHAADGQSTLWEARIRKDFPSFDFSYTPTAKTKFIAFLIRRLGPRAILPVLAANKVRGISVYSSSMREEHPMPVEAGAPDAPHKAISAGANLRAAVFGLNDGLVSNASLIFGVAGASAEPKYVLLSGVAGLLAGAFSMASGEYVSVRSQRELFEYQIALEKEELEEYPAEEARELTLIYEAKGIPHDDAKRMADKLIADPEKALDTLAREELGLNPDELGSPIGAALFSFIFFAFGAFIPLLPFLLQGSIQHPVHWTIGLSAFALLSVGALLSLFTGKSPVWGGLRMLFLGALAGTATYLIGKMLGVSMNS